MQNDISCTTKGYLLKGFQQAGKGGMMPDVAQKIDFIQSVFKYFSV